MKVSQYHFNTDKIHIYQHGSIKIKLNKADLAPQKIELLNVFGFVWTLRRKTVFFREEINLRMVTFKKHHGHTRVPIKWTEDMTLGKWCAECGMKEKPMKR